MIHKKSVTRQWFISYILLLMIPMIISGTVFGVLERDIKDETYVMNNMILTPLKNDIDNHLYTLKRVCTEITMGSSFNKTATGFKQDYREGFYQAQKLSSEAKDSVVSNEAVGCIYVSFDASDVALYSLGGVYDRKNINQILFNDENAELLSAFIAEHPKGGFCHLSISSYEKVRDTICYVSIVNENRRTREQAIVVVCADMDYIASRIEAMMGAVSRDFVIFDDNGQIVFTTNPDARVDMGKRDQGTYSDGEHVLSFVEFDLSNWCGVVVTPSEMFYKRLSVARTLYGLSVILSIVFGGICAWYMLKQNYKPVQSIIDLLEKKKRKAIQDGNEYAFLLETLSDMLENERATDKLLDKQSENLRRNFFIGLLYGNRDIKISEEIVGSIDFLSDNFIVLIFNAVNFTELFPEEKKMQEEQRKETAQFIITNIMTELIGKYHRCYMVEVGDELVGIVSLSPQRDEPERDVLEALNVGCSAIEDNFSLIMNVIVGALCENIEEISESYKEVFKALEYVRLTGQGGILRAREILENEEDDYSAYPPELDVRLANAIKSGKKDTATEVLEEIFNESVNSNRVIGRKERYLILEVVSTLLKVAGDETERKSLADICYMQDKTAVLKQELISVIDKLCDKNLIQIQEMSSGIELKVCDYIDEHYQEQTLTIQELGERFGLAPYYLSRNFKSKIGIGVAEYLRKIRVHKAQEIMSENEFIRLEEVAETVGLNGTRALTRAFKQELGILPTDFRASLIREK